MILGWSEGVNELLVNGMDPNVMPVSIRGSQWQWQELPIHSACRIGSYTIASQLIKRQCSLNRANNEGNYVLHLAAYSHNSSLLHLLLQEDVVLKNITSKNNDQCTPLHMLMQGEDTKVYEEEVDYCVRLLLQHGVETDAVDNCGRSALFLAVKANLPLVVETLIESRADPLLKTQDGWNILHAACFSGSHATLALLLQSDKLKTLVLDTTDKQGLAPFHLAANKGALNCCELLLQNGDYLANTDIHNRTRYDLLSENLSSASLQLIKSVLDSHIKPSNKEMTDSEFNIEVDFTVILSNSTDDVKTSLITGLMNPKTEFLLSHPLVESYLFYKWNKIKFIFYFYVFGYFIFLLAHTWFIVHNYGKKLNLQENRALYLVLYWSQFVILLSALVFTFVAILIIRFKKYLKQWETYFKFIALGNASLVVFFHGTNVFPENVSRNIAASSMFFTWVEFMMATTHFPTFGIYILMFNKVSKSILQFLFAFCPLFLAFSLCFSVLLSNVDPFSNYPGVFVRTVMMMAGEMDFGDIYDETKQEDQVTIITGQIFLVIFVIFVPILMTNLLTALAVSDLSDLRHQGRIRRLVKEATYVESYELLFNAFRQTRLPRIFAKFLFKADSGKRKITIWPNKKDGKSSVPLSKEILQEIVHYGKNKSISTLANLESAFKTFSLDYQKDRENFSETLEAIIRRIDGHSDEMLHSSSRKLPRKSPLKRNSGAFPFLKWVKGRLQD